MDCGKNGDCYTFQLDKTGAIWEQSASMIHPRSCFSTVKYKGKPMLLGDIVHEVTATQVTLLGGTVSQEQF